MICFLAPVAYVKPSRRYSLELGSFQDEEEEEENDENEITFRRNLSLGDTSLNGKVNTIALEKSLNGKDGREILDGDLTGSTSMENCSSMKIKPEGILMDDVSFSRLFRN